MIDKMPYPLTLPAAEKLKRSPEIRWLHPELVRERISGGEATYTIPAFLLVTQTRAYAIVENDRRDGYRVHAEGEDDDAIYAALGEWCEQREPPEPTADPEAGEA